MYEQYVDEGLSNLLSKFWSWLIGTKKWRKYDQYDDEYDEKEKKKYISSNYHDSIRMVEFKTEKELMSVIDSTIDIDNPQIGFINTYAYIDKHKGNDSKFHTKKWKCIDENHRWVGLVFNASRLKETFAIIAYSYEEDPDSAEIYFTEILPVYSSEIDYEQICKDLRELAKNVHISDEKFAKLLIDNGIDAKKDEDKNMYVL